MNEKIIYIYDEELNLIAQPFITTYEEFKENPTSFYPDWQENMYASENRYEYPILDEETSELREKTREERILLDNEIELLQDGEYIDNGKIIVVEYDESWKFYKKTWDKKNHIWYDATTKEEFIKMRADKILKYSELEENKKALENSKFSSTDEIALIVEEMTVLEEEINALAEKINVLKV